MTIAITAPSAIARGQHEPFVRGAVESPVGTLYVDATERAVSYIWLPGRLDPRVAEEWPASSGSASANKVLRAATVQLEQYFAGKREQFELPLELDGTPFQRQVWTALAEIPYGAVISYAELAATVGRPTAYRAVGQANGANPIPIVLPCHRVVASAGKIGGYGGGLDMKRSLLSLEGVSAFATAG